MIKIRFNYITISILLIWLLPLCGCVGYPDKEPSYLQQVDGKPNSFRMYVIQPFVLIHGRERIKAIQVYQPDESIHDWDEVKVYWRIIAEEPVKAEGFQITVGEVPDGFIQAIPSPENMFQPIPGKE
jgi:hypothetical protein